MNYLFNKLLGVLVFAVWVLIFPLFIYMQIIFLILSPVLSISLDFPFPERKDQPIFIWLGGLKRTIKKIISKAENQRLRGE